MAIPTPHRTIRPDDRLLLALLGLALLTAGVLPLAAAAGVAEVIIVFKTHFDIGYTDMASNVVQRYRTTMIDDALNVVDQNRGLPPDQQFVWTLPGWPMSKILEDWPGQTPERKQRILQALKDGRFVVHALPFTTHTELLEPEDLVRGLGFASRLARSVGLELPRDAKMTDVPCHSWIMPTLLKHAGVDFLHLGCNAASRSPEVPRLFWWEGADGSRVLTMYTAESYGTGLVPPADWPYKTWLALIHTGDNHGPPTPEEVRKLLEEAKEKLPGVKVRIGRLSDFSDGILAEKAEIPVVRGDMPDTWIHGPMSDPQGAKLARNIRPEIGITELLNTHLRLWGVPVEDAAPTVNAAYERSLLYGEHTWGGALYWVSQYTDGRAMVYGDEWKKLRAEGKYRRLEDSWAEHTAYIEAARDLIRPKLAEQLKALAGTVKVSGLRIVVFNPLPWKRDDLVEVNLDPAKFKTLKPVEAVSPKDSGPRPAAPPPAKTFKELEPTEAVPGGLRFIARDIPPMGYRTYVPSTEPAEERPFPHSPPFSNPLESIRLPELYLYERFDRDQVQAFVDSYVKLKVAWATNELGKPNLSPASEVPYRAVTPTNGQTSFDRTAVSSAAIYHAEPGDGLPHGVTIKSVVYRGLPFSDLEVTIHNKPADPWPEAGWIRLPAGEEGRAIIGRLGSLIFAGPDSDRTGMNLVLGAGHHLMAVQGGLTRMYIQTPQTVLGHTSGLCPVDSPLVSLELPGCWKYSRDFAPHKPSVYINLFNNQWTTNFRLWNEGTWSSRVRQWGDYRWGRPIVRSLEARYPLQAGVSEAPAGSFPPLRPGLKVSPEGVFVSAFGSNPDGEGIILRLWSLGGSLGPVQVDLPSGFSVEFKLASAQPVDLRGRPIEKSIPVRQGSFTFRSLVTPSPSVATFILSPSAAAGRNP
jgi:hypothetical protein